MSDVELDSSLFRFLHVTTMALSTGMGTACVLILSFVSVKLTRLVGRTIYNYGEEPDNDNLVELYGKDQLHKMLDDRIQVTVEGDVKGTFRLKGEKPH